MLNLICYILKLAMYHYKQYILRVTNNLHSKRHGEIDSCNRQPKLKYTVGTIHQKEARNLASSLGYWV